MGHCAPWSVVVLGNNNPFLLPVHTHIGQSQCEDLTTAKKCQKGKTSSATPHLQ